MRQQVNLYQPIFRKQEKKFSAKAMLQAMAAIVLGIAALLAWTQWQVRSLKGEIARADQQQVAVTKRLGEVMQQFGGQNPVRASAEEEIARLEQQLGAYQKIRDVLGRGLFSNTKGFSSYFVAFARQHGSGAVWLTRFDIIGSAEQMTLRGRSLSPEAVPRYVQRLSNESALSGIEFTVFQMQRSGAHVDFGLRTTGAPAFEESATQVKAQ